jgi:hypothetical protein
MNRPKRDILRNRDSVAFLREIRDLKNQDYSVRQIAEKANCCDAYVESMFYLLKHGHPNLIAEVEHRHLPHTIAIHIARAKDPELQIILANGYKDGTVNTSQIVAIRQRGDEYRRETSHRSREGDADAIIRIFSHETAERKLLIRKAKLAQSQIALIVSAFRQLFSDGRFVGLLCTEGIHTVPGWLAECIKESTEQCSINTVRRSLVELLKDKPISTLARNVLRRMSPTRQVEAAELMVSTGNFSRIFALSLLLATKSEDRLAWRAKPIRGISQERQAAMQKELECLLKDSRATENHSADVLSLVVASRYVSRLVGNREIEGYLHRNHPDILQKFRTIVATVSLDHSMAGRD